MTKPGDFFLLRGRDLTSRIIALATHGPFSHCGLITSDVGATIEALAHGVVRGTLSAYDPKRIVVVDSGLTDTQRATAVAFAGSCCGDKYGWLSIFGFAANLLSNGRLVIGEDGQYICSELVARAYLQAGVTLPDDPIRISPNDLARAWKVAANGNT